MAVSIREAKYLLAHPEILLGFAEGKIIEYKETINGVQWIPTANPSFIDGMEYRVKPEPRKFFLTMRSNGTIDFIYKDNDEWQKIKAMIDADEYGFKGCRPYTYVEVLEQQK